MVFYRLLLTGGLCLITATLFAQESSTTLPRTIEEMVTTALAHNAELKAYEAEVLAARGQRTQAGFFKNPEVSTEIGAREVRDDSNILQGNGTTFSISVTQTFEFPGKGSLRKAIANKNIEIAELGLEQFRLALAGRVRVLAYEYLAASTEYTATQEASTINQKLASSLEQSEATGAKQTLDRRLLTASLAEFQRSIRETATKREEALSELTVLLGLPSGVSLPIRSPLALPKAKLNRNELALSAQQANPLLKIRRAELEKASREVTAARIEVAPDFAVGPFFSRDVAGDTEQNIGASISARIPVWDWNVGNIATAKARQAQTDALRVQAERQLDHAVIRQARIYGLIRTQIANTPTGSWSETYQLADQQYRAGAIDVWRYIEVQKASLASQQIANEAILDAWRTWLDLNLLTGGALEDKK